MRFRALSPSAIGASCLLLVSCGAPSVASAQDPEPRSRAIRALTRAVESEGEAAVDAFRRELEERGTPLVEQLPGTDSILVTFVWIAERPRQNVVVQSWLESRSIERRAMRRLGESRVWYRSFPAPPDLTMGYLLSPDDARLLEGDAGDPVDTWTLDPLNPSFAPGALDLDWSLVELGEGGSSWWMEEGPEVPEGRIVDLRVESRHLEVTIPVKVHLPPAFDPSRPDSYSLLIFFDGFGFYNIDRTHRMVEALTRRGQIGPTVVAFVYNPDATRSRDMSCYEPTHRFLEEELVPLLRERYRAGTDPAETVIAGRSRSGLGAVCAAFTMPHLIGNAISQSGAFWWAPEGEETEWLARTMATTPRRHVRLYLDAGELEDGPNPVTGLSMLTVTRHLRDVARARGYDVRYREFPGGHDPIGWRTRLPDAVVEMFGREERR